MDGLKSALHYFHSYTLLEAVENKVENATMFSVNCGYIAYWKFEDNVLWHTSMFKKTEWVKTNFNSISEANRAGVVDIYNLTEVEEFLNA